jgi:predicted 3-demethylubiquinone-9 3-methyltransferase (glyoxalase superfamily)
MAKADRAGGRSHGRGLRTRRSGFHGAQDRCGWLKDKYGLSWQIVPTVLGKLMSDPDRDKAHRVMKAMLQMDKLDLDRLQQALQNKI